MGLKQAALNGLLIASTGFLTLVEAQGAPKLASKVPDKVLAEKLIRSAILTKRFKGGDISELILSDAERSGTGYSYLAEFTVQQSAKKIHCEDWRFVLEEKLTGWIAGETLAGRCND